MNAYIPLGTDHLHIIVSSGFGQAKTALGMCKDEKLVEANKEILHAVCIGKREHKLWHCALQCEPNKDKPTLGHSE